MNIVIKVEVPKNTAGVVIEAVNDCERKTGAITQAVYEALVLAGQEQVEIQYAGAEVE